MTFKEFKFPRPEGAGRFWLMARISVENGKAIFHGNSDCVMAEELTKIGEGEHVTLLLEIDKSGDGLLRVRGPDEQKKDYEDDCKRLGINPKWRYDPTNPKAICGFVMSEDEKEYEFGDPVTPYFGNMYAKWPNQSEVTKPARCASEDIVIKDEDMLPKPESWRDRTPLL